MTISTTTTRVAYTGDGITTAFTVPFPFFAADELEVIERDAAAGSEILRVLGTHYTVAGGNGGAGTVTATSAPLAAVQWVIRRSTARVQETDYTPNDPFPADTHEKALDRLTMIGQELGEESDRALKFPKTDAATLDPTLPGSIARAGRVLAFDGAGAPAVSAKTLAELESGATDAAASAAAALASQSAAAASASAALVSKNAAVLSETNAATSALAAEAAAASVGFSDVVFVTAAQSPIAIAAADSGRLYNCDTSGGAITFILPKISALSLPFTIGVKKTTADANAVTINSDAADTFDDSTTSKVLASQFGTTLIPDVDPNPDSWTAADWAGAAIPDGAITTAKIAAGAVTTDNVADGFLAATVAGLAKMADGFLAFAKIAVGAIASQAEAEAGAAGDKLMTPQRVKQAITAQVGTLNAKQLAKVWVNFNGTGTIAVQDGFNVSSITDNGIGDYTINFVSALPNASFAWTHGTKQVTAGNNNTLSEVSRSVSSLRVQNLSTNNGVLQDNAVNCVAIFGS
jgi:hypothetical protein